MNGRFIRPVAVASRVVGQPQVNAPSLVISPAVVSIFVVHRHLPLPRRLREFPRPLGSSTTQTPQAFCVRGGSFKTQWRPGPQAESAASAGGRAATRSERSAARGMTGSLGEAAVVVAGELGGTLANGATGGARSADRTGEPAERLPRSGKQGGGRGGWLSELPPSGIRTGQRVQKNGGMFHGAEMTTIPCGGVTLPSSLVAEATVRARFRPSLVG